MLIYTDAIYIWNKGPGEVTAPGLLSSLLLAHVLSYVP